MTRTRTRSSRTARSQRRRILVTGYPGFIGKRLVRRLLHDRPDRLYLLIQPKFIEDARRYIAACGAQEDSSLRLLAGDIADMHLGLAASEIDELSTGLDEIYHLAAISYLGVAEERMWQVNVQGTANLLEVAENSRRLKRFVHMSTCFVSGDRQGIIAEDELDRGQSFRTPYERTKFEAEKRVQGAAARLPITVLRPSLVVGDSRTGEIGRFDGPYALAILLAASPLSSFPLPGRMEAPLNAVPVDYVVEATLRLGQLPAAEGKTFHLVDPQPLSARRVYDLIALRLGRKPSRLQVPARLTSTVLGLPGLERIFRDHRQAIACLNTLAFYTSRNTEALLGPLGLRCPPLESYLDPLVEFVQASFAARQRSRDSIDDPLS